MSKQEAHVPKKYISHIQRSVGKKITKVCTVMLYDLIVTDYEYYFN